MIDTFLFDLDGTLLPLDMERFMQIYLQEITNTFSDIIEPKKLSEALWGSTKAMVSNLDRKTNQEVFMEAFFNRIEGDPEVYQKRFDHFYDHEFLKVRSAVHSMPLISESIEQLKKKGYQLILATNPLFPKKAIHHRIKWAGLHPEDFAHITSFEHCHYCKPQIQYFEEILSRINKQPHQCIMVGNDVQEDLIAGSLGMETFLITEHMIHRNDTDITCTYQGTYEDFYTYVQNLQSNT